MEDIVPAIIVIVACLALVVFLMARENTKLVDAGRIIIRKTDFMESAEEFTLHPVEPAQVSEALKTFNYTGMNVNLSGSTAEQVYRFTGKTFKAKLFKIEGSEEQVRYRFEFTSWKTNGGSVEDNLIMNELLTSVEKMFLAFDPNTQVKTIKQEFRTTH